MRIPVGEMLGRWCDRGRMQDDQMTVASIAEAVDTSEDVLAAIVAGAAEPRQAQRDAIERLTGGLILATDWGRDGGLLPIEWLRRFVDATGKTGAAVAKDLGVQKVPVYEWLRSGADASRRPTRPAGINRKLIEVYTDRLIREPDWDTPRERAAIDRLRLAMRRSFTSSRPTATEGR